MSAKGLGRGLSALFGDDPVVEDVSSSGSTLRISDIEPNPGQPRRHFDPEALQTLAESIRENGLLQPVVVRRGENGLYQIIAGERRWRACRLAGLTEIPAVILDADDLRAAQLALIENLQREDLNPIEEASGYQTLIETFGLTQEEAAQRVGRSRPAVANSLRLLALSQDLRAMVEQGRLSAGHARALLAIPDENLRREAAEYAVEQGLTVRELERYVKKLTAPEAAASAGQDSSAQLYVHAVSQRLSQSLGRRITLKPGRKKGKIEIEYYNNDDLDTLIALLENAAEK
ncbi:MAG: ParB/RepB/Spo0J family partition protein [Clostridiaceae bacterium]|nr:ParB/RepB/Spo0J family partition protein [Clostridiaceae bacterium]